MKTNKSYTKRLRLTKNGKLLARVTGQQHRHAGIRSGRDRMGKHGQVNFPMSMKEKSRFLVGF